jgi:hypothetical protein
LCSSCFYPITARRFRQEILGWKQEDADITAVETNESETVGDHGAAATHRAEAPVLMRGFRAFISGGRGEYGGVKRSQRALLISLGGALVVCVVWVASSDREPSYEGKTLGEWLQAGRYTTKGSGEMDPAFAIGEMGTNTLPYLLKAVSSERHGSEVWLTVAATRMRIQIVRRFLQSLQDRRISRAFAAEFGFRVLGAEAKSAVPRLTALLSNTNVAAPAAVYRALTGIGKDGLPPLLAAFSDEKSAIRGFLALCIVDAYRNANEPVRASEFWLECLKSKDVNVVNAAAMKATPFDFPSGSDLLIPALAEATRHSNIFTRCLVIEALPKFGAKARPAVPALASCLTDAQRLVRSAATNALMEIAPEVLTNGVAK